MTPANLHYSESLVRKAVAAFWWRTVGWRFVLALLAATVGLVWLVAAGDRSWLVGGLFAILVLALVLIAALYVVHLRSSLTRFRRMKVKEAKFEADSDRLRLTSDVGASEVSWSVVSAVWRFDEFWLLFFSRAQFVTLPVADLGGEVQAFIISKVQSHGGKVA